MSFVQACPVSALSGTLITFSLNISFDPMFPIAKVDLEQFC